MSTALWQKAFSPLWHGLGLYKKAWLSKSSNQNLTIVLCYHRVVQHANDNQGLFNVEKGVTARDFERQMRFMLKHFNPVKPSEVGQGSQSTKPQFAVTFDDGYLDNYTVAAPILEKLGISACFYVVTHALETHAPFWWEVLGQVLRHTQVTQCPVFELFPEYVHQGYSPKLLPLINTKTKEQAHARLSQGLLNGSVADIPNVLARLAKALNTPLSGTRRELPLMSVPQLRELVGKGFEIGGHTANHVNLGMLPPEKLSYEVTQSIEALKALIQADVPTFAFPYGGVSHQSDQAIDLIKAAGCRNAFTTEKRVVSPQESLFRLPRLQFNHPWAFACAKKIDDGCGHLAPMAS